MLYSLRNIRFKREEKIVLDIEKLDIRQGQIIGVFGPNGSGKSTLFSILSFVEKFTDGKLLYKGESIKNLEFSKRQEVVLLPQNPYLLKKRVFDNVAFGLKLRGDKNNVARRVEEALNQVGLEKSFAKRSWNELSGGEAQRVALAARLILNPKVLILDEPTSGVDTNSAQLIKEAVFQARQKWDTSIIISSHDHNWLNHTSDSKIALFQGKLIENDSINLLFAPWTKDEKENLVKEFMDGQKLVLENSSSKKRDSIVMINSEDITINKKVGLDAQISSIYKGRRDDEVAVEFLLSGITFNGKIGKKVFEKMELLPGDNVRIDINTSKVIWI